MAGSADLPSEFGVMVVWRQRQQQCYVSAGWKAVVRGLGLKAGDQFQLEPLCRGPWRFRLILMPAVSAALAPPNSEAAAAISEISEGAAETEPVKRVTARMAAVAGTSFTGRGEGTGNAIGMPRGHSRAVATQWDKPILVAGLPTIMKVRPLMAGHNLALRAYTFSVG